MAKKRNKIETKVLNHGLYAKWSNRCKELPRFLKYTKVIPARIEAEFGCIVEIKGAKNSEVTYTVEHPPFRDAEGVVEPPFTGSIPIRTTTAQIYLGDTLWEPVEDKVGIWRFIGRLDGEIIADYRFDIVEDTGQYKELIDAHAEYHLGKL